MDRNQELEEKIRAILQRHCDYGWGHHYILDNRFASLAQELSALLKLPAEASDQDLVSFLLRGRKFLSQQEKAAMMKREFIVLKREEKG